MDDNEDEQYIRAAQGGDEQAFGVLVTRYKDTVFATVVAITGDFEAAHDIGQEAFLRAWFGIGRLEDPASFGPWLRTIARNRSRTFLEKKQRQPAREAIDMDELTHGGRSPEQEVERGERQRMVWAALERLPELNREALVLHYMEGMTTPSMATQLGITEPAVRQRLRRARLQLQEEVEEMVADVIRDEAPGQEFNDNVQALLKQARGLFQQVKYGAAVPLLESAREQAPDDTMVSLLLAEAYTFTRSAEDLQEDRGSYDRALALLDEVLEREPDNMLARLRRAALRANVEADEEIFAEQRAALEAAKGSMFEAVAQLELARRYLTRMQPDPALKLYDELLPRYPWMACVLHSEMGVAHAMKQDGATALGHFERAVEMTTPDAMEALQTTSKQLMGEAYWAFWSSVDNLAVRQCQNHAWVAGLRSASGDMKSAREHVRQALIYIEQDEVGDARPMLRREFVKQMEQMFPPLAASDEVVALKRQVEEAG